jgi:hypothetical protein
MVVVGQYNTPAALPPGMAWLGPRASVDGYGKTRAHRGSVSGPSSQ